MTDLSEIFMGRLEYIIKKANTELMPCLFCNGKAEICKGESSDGRVSYTNYFIMCTICRSRTDSFETYTYGDKRSVQMAFNAWNRRGQ